TQGRRQKGVPYRAVVGGALPVYGELYGRSADRNFHHVLDRPGFDHIGANGESRASYRRAAQVGPGSATPGISEERIFCGSLRRICTLVPAGVAVAAGRVPARGFVDDVLPRPIRAWFVGGGAGVCRVFSGAAAVDGPECHHFARSPAADAAVYNPARRTGARG